MEYDLISVKAFETEARSLSDLIERMELPKEYKMEKITQEEERWTKNLLAADINSDLNLNQMVEEEAKLKDLCEKLKNSALATVGVYKEIAARTKRPIPSLIRPLPEETSKQKAIKDAVLKLEIYPSLKNMGEKYVMEVLGSAPIASVIKRLDCEKGPMTALHRLALSDFKCPPTITDLRNIFEDAGNGAGDQDWSLIKFGDAGYFGEGNFQAFTGKSELKMVEGTTWNDLNLRLCEPYPLMHKMFCEHLIIVRQIRLSTPRDAHLLKQGLVEISKPKAKRKGCRICEQFNATIMTHDDRLAPDNPCYFCTSCFEALHYDRNGLLVHGDFRLFPYLHDH